MRQLKTGVRDIPGDDIAVGQCVVVNGRNHTRGIAIITNVRGAIVEAVHVQSSSSLPDVIAAVRTSLVPVSQLGVRVRTNGSVYWCEKLSSQPQWQDTEFGEEFPVNRKALAW